MLIRILEKKQNILDKLVNCFQQLQPIAQHYQQYTTKIQEQDIRLSTLGEQIQLRLLWLDQQIDSFKNKATQTAQQLIVNQTNLNNLENAIKQTILTLKILEQTQAAQALEKVQNRPPCGLNGIRTRNLFRDREAPYAHMLPNRNYQDVNFFPFGRSL